jgi:small-conductance mechanosensitive channel
LLDLVLLRTFFPDNDEPHARRLFADLASGLIYALAFIGIVGTVFKEPVSTFLATSGVLAIVLGLALQNTLGDVLSGLAINIERPFGAGDWISLTDSVSGRVSGQVMQVNWRATRLKTWSHDMVVISNSVISKSMVTNHSFPRGPHRCVVALTVDIAVAPSRVIEMLKSVAAGNADIAHGTTPQAYACAITDSLVSYELAFAIDSFAMTPTAKSEMISRIAEGLGGMSVHIGKPAMDVRILAPADREGADNMLRGTPDHPSQVNEDVHSI